MDFYLDLTASSSCVGLPAIAFLRVNPDAILNPGGEISGLTIQASLNHNGIDVNRSSYIRIANNRVRDTGTGIAVTNSFKAIVDGNRMNRTDAAITLQNAPGVGGIFDSSETSVTDNRITDNLNRAMRLKANGSGAKPLRKLIVTGNTITNYGLTGIYVVAGVQNSRIENNYVQGAPNSYYALWIGSINPGEDDNPIGSNPNPPLNASFDNQINLNTFIGGNTGQFDVSFNGSPNVAGPDQPSISRGWKGNNTLGSGGIDPTASNFCSQYSHAYWVYQNGLNYVPSGGIIYLAAAGIYPGTKATYHIRRPNEVTDVMTITTQTAANSVCVLNQENSPSINLQPGLYDVYIDLKDGNARYSNPSSGAPVPINNWLQSVKLDVR